LALWFGPVVLATGSPTSNSPPPGSGPTSESLPFDKALKEARDLAASSLISFREARSEAEDWRLDSLKWQAEANQLSSELTKERKTSSELLVSLTDSLKREADGKVAVDEARKLDSDALSQARADRDAWRVGAIGAAVVAVAATIWAATR